MTDVQDRLLRSVKYCFRIQDLASYTFLDIFLYFLNGYYSFKYFHAFEFKNLNNQTHFIYTKISILKFLNFMNRPKFSNTWENLWFQLSSM